MIEVKYSGTGTDLIFYINNVEVSVYIYCEDFDHTNRLDFTSIIDTGIHIPEWISSYNNSFTYFNLNFLHIFIY